ncbi:hypothetical protein BANRA_04031 [Acinetobacter baumannii]|nr:hypothetical protein BANRA_04031 [Acinetobacter baumannii]
MKIKVSNGNVPALINLLKDTAATLANNVDVTSGVLRPFYKITKQNQLKTIGSATKDFRFYKFPDKQGFFQFPSYVDLTYSPIADDQYRRVYWSGDSRDAGYILYSYTPLITAGTEYNPKLVSPWCLRPLKP